MKYDETTYPFLKDDCLQLLGSEKGEKVFGEAQGLLEKLQLEADYHGSDVIKWHM